MDCAFDAVAFDAVAFDVCVTTTPTGAGWTGAWTYTVPVSEEDEEIIMLWREWINYAG